MSVPKFQGQIKTEYYGDALIEPKIITQANSPKRPVSFALPRQITINDQVSNINVSRLSSDFPYKSPKKSPQINLDRAKTTNSYSSSRFSTKRNFHVEKPDFKQYIESFREMNRQRLRNSLSNILNVAEVDSPQIELTPLFSPASRGSIVEGFLKTSRSKTFVDISTQGPARSMTSIKSKYQSAQSLMLQSGAWTTVPRIRNSHETLKKVSGIMSPSSSSFAQFPITTKSLYNNTSSNHNHNETTTEANSEVLNLKPKTSNKQYRKPGTNDFSSPIDSFLRKTSDVGEFVEELRKTRNVSPQGQIKKPQSPQPTTPQPSTPKNKDLKKAQSNTQSFFRPKGVRILQRKGKASEVDKKTFNQFLVNPFIEELMEIRNEREVHLMGPKKLDLNLKEMGEDIEKNVAMKERHLTLLKEFGVDFSHGLPTRVEESYKDIQKDPEVPKGFPKNQGFILDPVKEECLISIKNVGTNMPKEEIRRKIIEATGLGPDKVVTKRTLTQITTRFVGGVLKLGTKRTDGSSSALRRSISTRKLLSMRDSRFVNLRSSLKKNLLKWAKLGLTMKDIMEENLLNPKPYERVGSMQFIKFAKKGNFQIVGDMLFINRYHAFDVDHIGQTALHWAAKRGYAEVIVKMFEAGADVDKEDISGKTPLYFALKGNHLECVRLLLLHQAEPFSKKYSFTPLIHDMMIRRAVSKARQLHIIIAFHPVNKRNEAWEKKGQEIFGGNEFMREGNLLSGM